jgi:hypothetical protein
MSDSREMKPRWLPGHAVIDFRHRVISGACQHRAALDFLAVSRIAPSRPHTGHDHFAGAAGKQTRFLDRIEDYWKDTVVRDITPGRYSRSGPGALSQGVGGYSEQAGKGNFNGRAKRRTVSEARPACGDAVSPRPQDAPSPGFG